MIPKLHFLFLFFVFCEFVQCQVCPENYSYFPNGKCYRLFSAPVKELLAYFTCLNDNATLPIIHNQADNNVLTNVTSILGIEAWLGLYCSSAIGCKWDDGTAYNYQNFVNGAPSVNVGNCVYLVLAAAELGMWRSSDCNFDYRATVCQTDVVMTPCQLTCNAPFSLGEDGRCYYLNNNSLAYSNAENFCETYNADVVSIENSQQNLIVRNMFEASGIPYGYIGLTLTGTNYSWNDPHAVYNYTNWDSGFPQANYGTCVNINVGNAFDQKWRNVDCNQSSPFICSYGDYNAGCTTFPTIAPTTTILPDACGSYSYYNSGEIWSPNYPNYYGPSRECDYYLIVSHGSYVSVRFYDVDLKVGDYLDLFDGNNTLIIRLQNQNGANQYFYTSYFNSMKIVFVSYVGGATNRGWNLYFTSTSSVPTTTPAVTTFSPNVCPPSSYYSNGTIFSPGYPSDYGNELNCTYFLQAVNGFVVRIVFETFVLNRFDTVALYDGPNENSPTIQVLSGTYSPNSQIYQSTGSYMTVRFLTDSVATATGFLATFTSISATATTTQPSTQVCADGWSHDRYEKYCYKYFANGGTWQQNLQSCGSVGAQLLTIHDGQQEFDVIEFIRNMQGTTTYQVWIGLKKVDGSWQWSDGTPVNYLAFLPGEPSAAGNCAAIRGFTSPAGWLAVDCNTALPFICYHNALSIQSPGKSLSVKTFQKT